MTDSEYARLRTVVAEWIVNARMGYRTGPDDLAEQLEGAGIDLSPEWDEMEEE